MIINLYTFNFNMKKFIFKTSVFSITIFSFFVYVNYIGDAAKIFDTDYEKKVAEIIFSNNNVTNLSNYDERVLQKIIINNLDNSPDITILGSSTSFKINSTFFPDKLLLNNSVSGASIEDFIAIFQIYKSRKILPKKIIIGINPWLFNENNDQIRWKSLEKEYHTFFGDKSTKEVLNFKFKELLSVSYFQASIRSLIFSLKNNDSKDPKSTKENYNLTNTILVDGSINYSEKYRLSSPEVVKAMAINYTQGDRIFGLNNFTKISSSISTDFQKLCELIISNNIELSFYLSPYHPIVYNEIEKKYPLVLATEKHVVGIAQLYGVKHFGSFNPLNLKNSDFYDGIHLKEKAVKSLLTSKKVVNE